MRSPLGPTPQAAGTQPAPHPVTNRGIGRVIPACQSVIGTNVPGAINTTGKSCYLCGEFNHLAFSCVRHAPRRIGAPFPGWDANGQKIPTSWTSPTTISRACGHEWVTYLRHYNINGNPDSTGIRPPPNFAAVP